MPIPLHQDRRKSVLVLRDRGESKFEEFMVSHKFLSTSLESLQAKNIFYHTTVTKVKNMDRAKKKHSIGG